ncbi:MAG: hypothetical protein JWN70_908 [Planctomycetaceae bacterium]|nr:hypothetical protein [Planctomycetaceae bacterium]
MLKNTIQKLLLTFAFALSVAVIPLRAQVVSSGLTGSVVDNSGKTVGGATITALHVPTNKSFSTITGPNGRFTLPGLPVGGPYTISASASGATVEPLQGVETSLGEFTDVLLIARSEIVTMEKYVATASRSDLDVNSTGAGSVLSNRRINSQPSINRSFTDLIKTNPFVSVRGYPQVQALGMNYRYNSITLDGAKINDSFGLSSSGLFSAFNPFSLDAIEQFSVSLTPYDVRQSGFAGAAVNAVSKSGTNEFHGSVYDLFTDKNWQGPDVFGPNLNKRTPLKERTYGFTLGGPILKDRLFFFVNLEKFIQDSAPTLPGFTPDPAFVTAVQAKLASFPGTPNGGVFAGATTSRKFDTKRLAKIDWNISQSHRLAVRYSDTTSSQPNFGSFNYTSFSQPVSIVGQPTSFTNGGTTLSSNYFNLQIKEKVWASQLFSHWTPEFSTELDYSNTQQDSVRAVPISFPEIRIFNVPGTSTTGAPITNNDAFRFGSEISSMGNELHIKTQTMGASGDYVWHEYTVSGGIDYEKNDYLNLFRQGSYGFFDYNDLAAFQADTPYGFGRSVVQTGFPVADISKFTRMGYFGQVKWEPFARLNVILGMRLDTVSSPIAPPENILFKNAFGITNAGTVNGTNTPQPRFSFNYALDDARTTQVRGGVGVFLGRNPWVWISNSYGNTGVGRFNVVTGAANTPTLLQYLNGTYPLSSDPAYKFTAANPIGTSATGPSVASPSSINLIKPGMKFPTIQRGNLAIDRKLPFLDSVFTIEYIDTRQLSALFVDNMNLRPTTLGADGRQRFAGSATAAPLVGGFANVIRTRNVHQGASQYVSIGIERPFKRGWAYGLSYTHGHATDTQGLGSSTANSQWQFNNVFNQNAVEVARSDYEIRHRVMASVSKEFNFKKNFPTTISVYYEGRSGQPYSFVYTNDLNNDGFSSNDLVAVPTGSSDPRFDFSGLSAPQQDAYLAFMRKDLGSYAGGYAPRNAFFTPWQNRLDLRIVQELHVYRKAKLELFADFLNFGSWLNKNLFNYVEEINTSTGNSSQIRTLGSATYSTTGLVKPTANVDSSGNITFASSSTIVPNNADSRWKIQGGVRLKF